MKSWTTVSRSDHINKRWRPRYDFHFAATQQVAEVLMNEVSDAIPHYALGFVKQDDKYQFVALLSIGGERNVYVNKENKWMCQYVPATVRGYPFMLADKSGTKEKIFCIAESHLIDDEPNSLPIFDDKGELASEAYSVLQFLEQCDNSRDQTQVACRALADAGVIGPWELKVKTSDADEDPQSIGGVYRINEAALNKISKPALIRLRETGALPLAYAQLFSIKQFGQLGQRAEYLAKQQHNSEELLDLTGLFEDEGSLNFDAL